MSLKFASILIVTYGRSGSTLLQGLINSIDGVLVRGENEDFIFGLYEAYKRLSKAKSRGIQVSPFDPTHPWYGAHLLDTEIFIKYCNAMLRDLILSDLKEDNNIKVYGFKEVRYHLIKDIDDYLDFLYKVFPNACFIFNTRNMTDVVNSSWWKNQNEESVRKILSNLEEKLRSYARKNPHSCFSITYEDMIKKSENLRSLFKFIGAKYVEEEIDNVLNKKHSDPTRVLIDSYKKVLYSSDKYCGCIKTVIVDNLPEKIFANTHFGFQGVVVPVSNGVSVSSVKAVTSNSTFNATLGLSSPIYGAKYPEINSSSRSRFRIDNVFIKQKEKIKLIAEIVNVDKVENIELATIEIY
jgi:hypothetical protein